MITSKIKKLRDPFILVENGVYYAYGTGWHCYKNTSGDLAGEWEDLGVAVEIPEKAKTNFWAPEVHKYKGSFYMFTTYLNRDTEHRGCVIMKSDSPEGPFKEITNGPIAPADWDTIDGTFYIDEEGQPWMIFVHEWTSLPDEIGLMCAAKLSDDLTHFVSEPIDLFRADDAEWAQNGITDGCFMYKCKNGELLMLWSNWDWFGYVVGIAKSDNGRLDGKWSHESEHLYTRGEHGEYDGGHGMIFTGLDGKMYLSLHSPNAPQGDREEVPVFVEIKEENGMLVRA